MAHVNATEFQGRPPGTVLFATGQSLPGERLTQLNFAYCADGWSRAFELPCPSADFAPLILGEVDVTEGYGQDVAVQPVRVPHRGPGAACEAEPPGLEIALGWHEGDPRTLAVRVRNVGEVPIAALGVAFVWDNEIPQPGQLPEGVPYLNAGGCYRLEKEFLFNGILTAGLSTTFAIHPMFIEAVRSQVAALSPERYRLAVYQGETELAFVEGADLGAFLDGQ